MSASKPVLKTPLIYEPVQTENPPPKPPKQFPPIPSLGPLAGLIGTWTNKTAYPTSSANSGLPFSYNLMPLPQVDLSSPSGYILKNFAYYEEITFSCIYGNAPNRGGTGTQVANTLFYEQRVYFAEGPAKDSLVHAENGSWLYLTDKKQLLGPYGPGFLPKSKPPKKPVFNIIKQLSVPHGNSILAPGSSVKHAGVLKIPETSVLPKGVDTTQYTKKSVGNPNPTFTLNPNQPLADALTNGVTQPSSYIQFDIDTVNGNHPVINILFEKNHADVTSYKATYWLETFDNATTASQLQYSQTIRMDLMINGEKVSFPHVTTNTLTKIS